MVILQRDDDDDGSEASNSSIDIEMDEEPSYTSMHQIRRVLEACIGDLNKEMANANTMSAVSLFGSGGSLNGPQLGTTTSKSGAAASITTETELRNELRLQKIDNYCLKELISYQLRLVNLQSDQLDKRDAKNLDLCRKIKELEVQLAESQINLDKSKSNQKLIGRHEQETQTSSTNLSFPIKISSAAGRSSAYNNANQRRAPLRQNQASSSTSAKLSGSRESRDTDNDDAEQLMPTTRSHSNSSAPLVSLTRTEKSKRRSSISSSGSTESKKNSSGRSSPPRPASPRTLRNRVAPFYFPPQPIRRLSTTTSHYDGPKESRSSPNTSTSSSPSTSMFSHLLLGNVFKKTVTPIIVTTTRKLGSSAPKNTEKDEKSKSAVKMVPSSSSATKMSFGSGSGNESTSSKSMDMKSKCVKFSTKASVRLIRTSPADHPSNYKPAAAASTNKSVSSSRNDGSSSESSKSRGINANDDQKPGTSSSCLSSSKVKKVLKRQRNQTSKEKITKKIKMLRLRGKPAKKNSRSKVSNKYKLRARKRYSYDTNDEKEVDRDDDDDEEEDDDDDDDLSITYSKNSKNSGSTNSRKKITKGKMSWPPNVIPDADDNCLLTNEEYYTMDTEIDKPNDDDEKVVEKTENENVMVPSWRVMEFCGLKSRHQEEDWDDSAYHKRHAKLEIDEKRRKRWDAQKQRQENYTQKLKERQASKADRYKKKKRNGKNSANDDDFISLLPDCRNAKYIRVDDIIPVCAFGYAVPNLEPAEFERPWTTDPEKLTEKMLNSVSSGGPKISLSHSNRRFSSKPARKV